MCDQKESDYRYSLINKDHLDMFKYYEDKASSVKGAMFRTFTWVIGFATALLGLTYSYIADFDPKNAIISRNELIMWFSLAGMAICVYSWFMLYESASHIKYNWKMASRFKKLIDSDILNPPKLEIESNKKKDNSTKKDRSPFEFNFPVWQQLAGVSIFFFLTFVITLVKFGLNDNEPESNYLDVYFNMILI